MTAVAAQTFPPAPGGMNTALAPQEIDDTEAQYLQDILLDYLGVARRRGPIASIGAGGPASLSRPGTGLAITIDPAGTVRYGALSGNGSNGYFTVWSDDLSTTVDLSWPHILPTDPASAESSRYRLHSATPGAGGGTWIGAASDYGAVSPLQGLAFWHGGNKADYSTGTITLTRGSTAVTGSGTSWAANVVPGMFLFANTDDASAGTFTDTLIGTVLSVNSNTSITLTKPSPYTGSAGRSYTLRSIRGFIPKVNKGRITCDTGSTTVSGGNTKFAAQGLGSGTWNLYRASDLGWIGKVSSVASDISLTLAANAALSLADDEYIAVRGDWSSDDKSIDITLSTSKVGWITASYAERQWFFANGAQFDKTFRGWFADTFDPETVDLSADGDWLPISSTSDVQEPIRGAAPTYNAILVMKDSETFAIYGTSPDDFSAKKLADDGALSTMAIQPYGGGAVWAGRNGIYYYDGVQVVNLTERKLGGVYKNTIRSLDQTRYRAWSMIARNHYWLFLEDLDPTISVIKGNASSTPNHWVILINLDTGAVSLQTNIGIRGAITLPASEGRDTWFLVNDYVSGEEMTNPGFELGTSPWTRDGATAAATLTQVTSPVKFGNYAGKIEQTASPANPTWWYPFSGASWGGGLRYGMSAGGTATFAVWIYIPTGANLTYVDVGILDFDGANSTSTMTSANLNTRDQWQLVTATHTLQADAVDAFPLVRFQSATVPSHIFVDGATIQTGSTAATYTGDGQGHIVSANSLYDSEGVDDIYTVPGGSIGPDFYFHSKKYNAGDDVWLKRFKQFAMHYMAQGGALNIDVVLGLNNIGQTLSTQFEATVYTWSQLQALLPNWSSVSEEYPSWSSLIDSVFLPKRVRFTKKDHHLSFRVWQSSANMTRVKIGPFNLAYKLMRRLRVR